MPKWQGANGIHDPECEDDQLLDAKSEDGEDTSNSPMGHVDPPPAANNRIREQR